MDRSSTFKTLVLASLVMLTVSGCDTIGRLVRPQPNPAKVVVRIPPEGMIRPCKYIVPPTPAVYMTLSKDDRELMLASKLREQLYNTADCDGSEVFKKWRADQLRLGVLLED